MVQMKCFRSPWLGILATTALLTITPEAYGCRLFNFEYQQFTHDRLQSTPYDVVNGTGPRHHRRYDGEVFPDGFGEQLLQKLSSGATIELDIVMGQLVVLVNEQRDEFFDPLQRHFENQVLRYAETKNISYDEAIRHTAIARIRWRKSKHPLNLAPHTDVVLNGTQIITNLHKLGTAFSTRPLTLEEQSNATELIELLALEHPKHISKKLLAQASRRKKDPVRQNELRAWAIDFVSANFSNLGVFESLWLPMRKTVINYDGTHAQPDAGSLDGIFFEIQFKSEID